MLVFAVSFLLCMAFFGYLFPTSLPGKFVHTTLSIVGLGAKNYKEKNALANYHRAVENRQTQLGSGVDGLSKYDAVIKQRERAKEKFTNDAALYEDRLACMDDTPDDDPIKLQTAESLIQAQESLNKVTAELDGLNREKQAFLGDLQAERKNLQDATERGHSLEAELAVSEARKTLTEQRTGFQRSGIDTTNEAAEIIQARIDNNNSQSEVLGAVYDNPYAKVDAKVASSKAKALLAERRNQKQLN